MTGRQKKDKMRVEAGFTFEEVRAGGRHRGGGGNGHAGPSNDGNAGNQTNSRRAAFGGNLTTSADPVPSASTSDSHRDLANQTTE